MIYERYFLSDAVFLVALEGEKALLETLQAGLQKPRWFLFFGRRAFVRAARVWLPDGLRDEDSAALEHPTVQAIYSKLVRLDEGANFVVPALAESWESDDTGQVWTFHLRQGVTFHDGTPFTSQDVIYTLQRVVDPAVGSPIAATFDIIDVDKLEAPDDYTVVIPLKTIHSDFPLLLTTWRMRMIPDGSGDTIGQTGIGAGPFKVENFDPEGVTTLVAFDDYWEGPPGLAGIELYGIASADAWTRALLADQIEYAGIGNVRPEDFPLFEGTDEFTLNSYPSGGWSTLVMDTTVPPFDDVRVRQAFKLVVDRQEMLDVVLAGDGAIACDTPVWSGDPYYVEQDCQQDIERAKELLAEAGYPDGIDVVLTIADVYPTFIPKAVAYKEQAALAGINVEINQVPADGYWSDVWQVEPFFASWWGQRGADQALNEIFSCGSVGGNNESKWCNEEFDQLLADARAELDFEKRKALYAEAQQLLSEEGGSINPVFFTAIDVHNSRVKGVTRNFTEYLHLFSIEQ